jgi:hypothetical protein
MSGITPIFRGTTGLYDTMAPDEIPFDAESGITALAEAVNVTVSDSGRRIETRKGYVSLASGNCHSLFCYTGDCLMVKEDSLFRLDKASPGTLSTVATGFAGVDHVGFAQVGNDIYYTSASKYGIVTGGGGSKLWTSLPYIGPDTNKDFSGPFPARHIAFHASRIFLSIDNRITFSEPFAYSWFDLHGSTLQLDSTVVMMRPVDGGMFISTLSATYFLKGREPKDFELILVASYPALEWSGCAQTISGFNLGFQEPGEYAAWNSTMGLCVGSPSGAFYNLTKDTVLPVVPSVAIGAGVVNGLDIFQLYNDGTGLFYNVASKAATRLSNIPFSAMCKCGDYILMAGNGGLASMEGETDGGAEIQAWFVPATTDFGSDKPKHIRFMYFGFRSSGDMILTIAGESGSPKAFLIAGSGVAGVDQRRRVPIGRSEHRRFWSYKLSNKSGKSFSVGQVDCLFIGRSHGFSENS